MAGIDGQTERPNGAFGQSDIEGKAARVAASELGSERVSSERERMSQRSRSLDPIPAGFSIVETGLESDYQPAILARHAS